MDGLAVLQHLDEGRDLLLPSGLGLHVERAEGQREAVLRTRASRTSPGPSGSASIAASRSSGIFVLAACCRPRPSARRPSPPRPAPSPCCSHPGLLDQPRDVVDVDLAPDALLAARRVALQEALVVEALADAVDPAPAEHHVDGLLGRDRREPGAHLVDLDPDLALLVPVLARATCRSSARPRTRGPCRDRPRPAPSAPRR